MMGLIKNLLLVGMLAGCTPPPAPTPHAVPLERDGGMPEREEEWCRPPNYIVPCVEDETEECCAAVEMYGYSSD